MVVTFTMDYAVLQSKVVHGMCIKIASVGTMVICLSSGPAALSFGLTRLHRCCEGQVEAKGPRELGSHSISVGMGQ